MPGFGTHRIEGDVPIGFVQDLSVLSGEQSASVVPASANPTSDDRSAEDDAARTVICDVYIRVAQPLMDKMRPGGQDRIIAAMRQAVHRELGKALENELASDT